MKKIIMVLLVSLAYSCGMKPKQHSTAAPVNNNVKVDTANNKGALKNDIASVNNDVKTDTINQSYVDDFIQFRKAVCQGDVAKLEEWFKFPISNPRDMWFLIIFNGGIKRMDDNDSMPLRRKEFRKFFKYIFPNEFINSIVEIKPEELLAKGKTSTPDFTYITGHDRVTYKMFAKLIREDTTLNLSFISSTGHLTKDGLHYKTHHEGTGIIYKFDVKKKGQLQFKQIIVVG